LYKNKLGLALKESENRYYTNLLLENRNSTQKIWKVYGELMSNKKKKNNSINKILFEGNEMTDPADIANTFNKYFSTIGLNLAKKFKNDNKYKQYLDGNFEKSMFLLPVTELEVLEEIQKLAIDKSPGHDEISPKLIKTSVRSILTPLTNIFNKSFEQGIVPEILKIAKVIPLFKKKDPFIVENYRPISLLSIFNKLLEKLMCRRLLSYLSKEHILYKFQFGFRKNHSTILAIIEIVDNIRSELDKGNSVVGVYLDLSKAFDTVNHEILLSKLLHYGIRGNAYKWFKSYLENRKQVTCVNRYASKTELVNIGVPQGSVLGPILFLLYVNDMYKCIGEEGLRIFADDTNLFISGNSFENIIERTEQKLHHLYCWFAANHLTLNIDKTMCSLFTLKRNKNCRNPKLNDIEIQRVAAVKYLGVFIDEKLNWQTHIDYICKKLNKLQGALHYLAQFLPEQLVTQVYNAYVLPHITYGIEVYGTCCKTTLKKLERIQNRMLKILCKKKYRDSATALYNNLKLMKCKYIYKCSTVMFVYKQMNNKLPAIFNGYFTEVCEYVARNTRQSKDLSLKKNRLQTMGDKTMKHKGATLWNKLPIDIRTENSVKIFKRSVKAHYLSKQLLKESD